MFYSVLCVIFVLSLEVTLQKRSEGPMWPELVIGDRSGEHVMSDEQAALIHERLSHLTSDELVYFITNMKYYDRLITNAVVKTI